MPFTVQDLIEDKPKPVTVSLSDSTQKALELMVDGDFSQLPVVNEGNKVTGIITSDSIVRTLNNFDLTIKEILVKHAVEKVLTFRPEDDLFGLLDDLKDIFAVVVVDSENHIVGIITNYDTTEYFRRRGEDIMLVEDIESMLKDYILNIFQDKKGETNETALENAINEITPSNAKFRKDFGRAFNSCLKKGIISDSNLDRTKAEEVFIKQLSPKQTPKPFDRLTLNEYIELFLSKKRWKKYQDIFELEANSCRKLLNPIREIRNALAHFRADLTSHQRQQLRFCKEWLARHQDEIIQTFDIENESKKEPESKVSLKLNEQTLTSTVFLELVKKVKGWKNAQKELPPQFIEKPNSNESRYSDLASYLQSISPNELSIQLKFSDIEEIINAQLPKTAYQHRSWWANDSVSHVQSKQWLEVGWRVSSVNMSQEKVKFSRIKEREQQYIEFFSKLLLILRDADKFDVKELSPTGRSFITVNELSSNKNKKLTFLGCSFARGNKFRVELYIDSGNEEINDKIYSSLYNVKRGIERDLRKEISWERLDNRRASRIAIYHEGSIIDDEKRIEDLLHWAVEMIIRFNNLFHVELKDMIVLANKH